MNLPGGELCKGHCTVTKLQNVFVSVGILPVKLDSADREIDNGFGTTLISWDALARLGLRRNSKRLTIKTVTDTARINSVSKAFHALPMKDFA